jgi:catechol 2,3-dioxygenase-like lactoylglutathione lyase family enzyme
MPRLVGINHIALEVDDIAAALEWYGQIFELGEIEHHLGMAFMDMGDQFIGFSEGRSQQPDTERHFGLVVDDKEATRSALEAAGAEIVPSRGLDFLDPWGNHVQVVDYREIQFTKAPGVLHGMGLDGLEKHASALAELRAKNLAS